MTCVKPKGQIQEAYSPPVVNNSNMTDAPQKSIAGQLPFLELPGQSAGKGALLRPGTLPGSSTENKMHNREG